ALAAQRLPQLDQPTGFDLPDTLAGDAVAARHLIQRPRLTVSQPKPQLDHFALALRERAQHFADAVAQKVLIGGVARAVDARIIEEIAERAFSVVAQRLLQTDRLPRHSPQRLRILNGDAEGFGDLLKRRLTTALGDHLAADALHRR